MAEFIVTLAADADLPAIARQLTAAGFTVEQELATIGVLTGQADPSAVRALAAIAGVAAVEASTPVHIASPGSSGVGA